MAKSKNYRLKLSRELCKGCRLCIDFCPKHVLTLAEDKINAKGYPYAEATAPGNCVGCLTCVTVCPDCVIEIFETDTEGKP